MDETSQNLLANQLFDNKYAMNRGLDCSEIAEEFYKLAEGKGNILYILPEIRSNLALEEFGRVDDSCDYHYVYTDGKYIYEPRYSQAPVEKDVYFRNLSELNPKGFVVTTYW